MSKIWKFYQQELDYTAILNRKKKGASIYDCEKRFLSGEVVKMCDIMGSLEAFEGFVVQENVDLNCYLEDLDDRDDQETCGSPCVLATVYHLSLGS